MKIFNEEESCDTRLAEYPALTEDEVIAATVAGPGYGPWGEVWHAQKDTLWKIAKDRVLPKGSLLVATSAPNVQESPSDPAEILRVKVFRLLYSWDFKTTNTVIRLNRNRYLKYDEPTFQ